MTKPTLFVLAAGMGSRYGGLKQMDSFGPSGESIIDYSVYDAIQAGFGKVVFVVRAHFIDEFRRVYDGKFARFIETDYVIQELDRIPTGLSVPDGREKPWGTAHAVMMGAAVINEPFAVINADDFYGKDAFKKVADFLRADDSDDYCMVAYYLKNTMSEHGTVNRGVCMANENNELVNVVETVKIGFTEDHQIQYPTDGGFASLSPDTLVSMNMWGFKPSYFSFSEQLFSEFYKNHHTDLKSEFFIPLVVDQLIESNTLKVHVLNTTSSWFGVTYPEDKPAVVSALNQLIDEGAYPENLWAI